jgi:hypothetical protein
MRLKLTSLASNHNPGSAPARVNPRPGAWNTRGVMTAIAIIVVMSSTVAGCGADHANDKANRVTQTVQPDQATRPSPLPFEKEQGAGPRCRDPEVCMR